MGHRFIATSIRNILLAALFSATFASAIGQPPPPAVPQQPTQTAPQTPGQAPDQTRDLKTIDLTKKTVPVNIPRSYALVIGIAHYKNLPATAQLAYPNRDAESVYTTLISADGGQFPAENVHKLVDEKATIENIRHEIEVWLPSVTRDDDRVVIYFAGHGFVSEGKGYLATYDVDIHNITKTAYPMDELGKEIGTNIKGKWKVLITDSCHSGAITPEADRAKVNSTLLDLQKSLFSLTASRDREQSFESDQFGGGHGVFTYYVVKGLEGEADTDGDGVVTADELSEYVHTNVRLATQAQQNPTSERGSFDPNMVLAYNPNHVKAGNLPPPAFGNLVIETNMDATEVWIDGKSAGVVNKGTPLRLPGIQPGAHTIKAVHLGYEPDGPREEQVYPGQDTTVSVRILIARQHNKAAVDHFDKGIEDYNKGNIDAYKKAADEFRAALAVDPKYSQAALYLGRVENAVYDDKESIAAFKTAIDTDPDYMEARSSYAGALLDQGDTDEAIRQLNIVTDRDPSSGMGWYLLSQAYYRKGDFKDARSAGEQAIAKTPNNGEAHFWLAEALRQLLIPADSEREYNSYLALTNFDTGFGGKLNYYAAGFLFGMGYKKRAAQTDIWREMHGLAEVGLCDCNSMQKNYTDAIQHCQKALNYLPKDIFANYRLGTVYAKEFNQQNSVGYLAAAKEHFSQVVANGPDTNEASLSKKYIQQIDSALAQLKTN
jgi:tetratricopeptide (TPR) repeat protein